MGFIKTLSLELSGKIEAYLDGRISIEELSGWANSRCASLPVELETALLLEILRTIQAEESPSGENRPSSRDRLHVLNECLRGQKPFCLWLNVRRDLTFLPGRAEKDILEILEEFLREGNLRHPLDCEKLLEGLDFSQPESMLCQEAVFGMSALLDPGKVHLGNSFFTSTLSSSRDDCDFGGTLSLTAETAEARRMLTERLQQIKNALLGLLPYAVFARQAEGRVSASLAFFGFPDREETLYRTMKNRYAPDVT